MNGPDGKHDSKIEGAGKLVGGYASKNLSEQEKQALFDAALHDQQLFDALMQEQALQDLLEEPGVKPELILALQAKATVMDRFQQWIKTPIAWGVAGAVTTAAVLLMVMVPPRTKMPSLAATASRPAQEQAKELESQKPLRMEAPAQPVPQARPLQAGKQGQQALHDSVSPPPPAKALDMAGQVAQESAPAVVELKKSDTPLGQRRDERREQAAAQPAEPPVAQSMPSPAAPPAPAPAVPNSMSAPAPTFRSRVAAPSAAGSAALGFASAAALSVDYTLLRRNADGMFEPATTVRATDVVRLQVTPSHAGYLYLYRRDANGGNTTIVGAQRVTARQAVVVPSQGSLVAGNQQYLLTFARDTTTPTAENATGPIGAIKEQAMSKAKRSAEQDSAASSVRSVPSSPAPNQKAILPAASGSRATATSVDPNTVMLEITIRPEEN